jgi:hypothetical protein
VYGSHQRNLAAGRQPELPGRPLMMPQSPARTCAMQVAQPDRPRAPSPQRIKREARMKTKYIRLLMLVQQ